MSQTQHVEKEVISMTLGMLGLILFLGVIRTFLDLLCIKNSQRRMHHTS